MTPESPEFRAIYTPDVDGAADERSQSFWPVLRSAGRIAGTVIVLVTAGGIIISALGFRRSDPEARIASLELRVTALEQKQDLTAYILCVQFRRTDPAAVPPGCDPIVQRGPQR